MEIVRIEEYNEEVEFAKRAGKHFSENKECTTFTDSDIDESTFIAIRWGMLEDCVVVVKRDESHKPKIYEALGR